MERILAEVINREDKLEGLQLKTYLTIKTDCLEPLPTPLDVSFKKWFKDRSKDQNAKYWSCVKEIARLMETSSAEVHSLMLERYGVLDKDENGNVIKVLMKDDFQFEKSTDIHLFPTKHTTTIQGTKYRLFYKLKNSSDMKSDEFSKLLEGALSELEELK